jgi:hypothetical protein
LPVAVDAHRNSVLVCDVKTAAESGLELKQTVEANLSEDLQGD